MKNKALLYKAHVIYRLYKFMYNITNKLGKKYLKMANKSFIE